MYEKNPFWVYMYWLSNCNMHYILCIINPLMNKLLNLKTIKQTNNKIVMVLTNFWFCQQECSVCPQCLSEKQTAMLKEVFWEHLKRGTTRLAYPYMMVSTTAGVAQSTELISTEQ